jgi:hypothetical protein
MLLLLALFLPKTPSFREKSVKPNNPHRYVSMEIYARDDHRGYHPLLSMLKRGSPLAFAYSNLSEEHYHHLMLFAIDEYYTVYWFYPEWTDPRENPCSVSIGHGTGRELPDEVRHDYQGVQLRFFAIFTKRRDVCVQQIEALVEQIKQRAIPLEKLTLFPLGESGQHTILLRVEKR